MKKILFATTALVATASVAAADVNFSGYGRFGIQYNSGADEADGEKETRLRSRFRFNIDANATTDGGVDFSARVRLQADDNADGTAGAASLSGARFTTQYEGLRVDVGNISGTVDNLPDFYGFEPGLTAFTGQTSGFNFDDDAFSSTGAGVNGVFAQYAIGDFAVSGSFSPEETGAGEQWGISGAYAGDTFAVAVTYSENDPTGGPDADQIALGTTSVVALTASATFGAFSGTLLVGNEDADNDNGAFDTFWGLSANYELGTATDIQFSYGDGAGDADTQAFALGFVQDLGGGVDLKGAVGTFKPGGESSETFADLGVQFNF
ncbi:porin [Ruegeria sp. 2205SS24-7]|uniref:porin n=1 Tax=Ruegeria discodermiae TaxID=3064389 RepID=UPI0027416F0C|nr:porin [Ruegeria sp. 2205SS24-7]MDP5218262.1 porin [Ruegeria sp. 2205SS24-7]